MADFYFNDGPMPYELSFGNNIKRWGDPWGGGWQGWPAMLHLRLNHAQIVFAICESWDAIDDADQGAWIKKNPNAWEQVIEPLIARKF